VWSIRAASVGDEKPHLCLLSVSSIGIKQQLDYSESRRAVRPPALKLKTKVTFQPSFTAVTQSSSSASALLSEPAKISFIATSLQAVELVLIRFFVVSEIFSYNQFSVWLKIWMRGEPSFI
jgi:hypothetical protein